MTRSLLADDPVHARSTADKLEALGSEKFFHDMLLGSERTGSSIYPPELPPNYHLFPIFRYLQELDLAGAECLDIGTFDGMTAFVLDELGAATVHATCQYDLDRFRLARSLLDAGSVAYYPKTEIEELPDLLDAHALDLVVVSAMLHHLPSPLDAVLLCRRLLKLGGFLAIEAVITDSPEPTLTLNTEIEDPVFGVPTLWLPSAAAVRGMLHLASFEIVSETLLTGGARGRETNYDRVTLLARAVAPSALAGATDKVQETLANLDALGPLDISGLEDESAAASGVSYSGPAGPRTLNIWSEAVELSIQPGWSDPAPAADTGFRIARDSDFRRLVAAHPGDAFTKEDLQLLAVKYPGEVVPEGMRWSLKQLGNLFVLDHLERWGSRDVLEIGPGFNFYFPNHLPDYCAYTALDAEGFYEPELLALMRARLPRGRALDGLIGDGSLESESLDACISVSVLEHLAEADISKACGDMFRILRPGGWSVHTIDLPAPELEATGAGWLAALRDAGFLIDPAPAELGLGSPDLLDDPPHSEPLAITMRFYGSYSETIWRRDLPAAPFPLMHSILIAARKPPAG